jgi:chromate reductase
MTRILLITGGTSEGSLHTAALRTAVRFAPDGLSAALYDELRELPAFVPGEQPVPATVARLREEVAVADALLFSTPEYAGSLPGSLKNLIDWLVDGGDLSRKPAAWLSVAPPGQDESALTALETALSFGNAKLQRPACVRVPLDPAAVDAQGVVTDPQLHRALGDILRALVRSAAAPKPRAQPSWQAYSSVFPVVMRRDASTPRGWRPPSS